MSRMTTNIAQPAGSRRSTLVAVTAAIIGIIYGYDLGNISGALLFIPAQFHLSTFEVESVATVVVVGSIVGVLLGGPIANAFGRKPIMVAVAFSYAAFAILSALSTSLVWLDITRFFLGVTIGVSIVVAPIFVAESVPAKVRGRLVVMYQLATVAGIMIAYFIDYGLAFGGQWRIMLGLEPYLPLSSASCFYRCPIRRVGT
jgi:MFS family permease